MLNREEPLSLARKLDSDYSYVREEEVFLDGIRERPLAPHSEWNEWEESLRTSCLESAVISTLCHLCPLPLSAGKSA